MGRNERLNELAEDLVRSGVDLIVTEGTPSTQAAIRATKGIIPVVFGSMQDPVEKVEPRTSRRECHRERTHRRSH